MTIKMETLLVLGNRIPIGPCISKVAVGFGTMRGAGYKGIELGPINARNPSILAPELERNGLSIIGGVVFRPFHDAEKWDEVLMRQSGHEALVAHGAEHLVLIDSISPRRPTAVLMKRNKWIRPSGQPFADASKPSPKWVRRLWPNSRHPRPRGGFVDFEPELERLLDEVDERS